MLVIWAEQVYDRLAAAHALASAERARCGQFYGLCWARALQPVMWPVLSVRAAARDVASAERARFSQWCGQCWARALQPVM